MISVSLFPLKTSSLDEYCSALSKTRTNGFWWYMSSRSILGNHAKPFRVDNTWFFDVKPGLCWAADIFSPLNPTVAAAVPGKKRLFGIQVPVDETAANAYLLFNVINDLQGFCEGSIHPSKHRALRKAQQYCTISVLTSPSHSTLAECLQVWNSLVKRTGWKNKMSIDQFERNWTELRGLPGTSILTCAEKESRRVVAWIIIKIIDKIAYVDTIASQTEYMHLRPNDLLLYSFLCSARSVSCIKAHYSLVSPVESLENIKKYLGFSTLKINFF